MHAYLYTETSTHIPSTYTHIFIYTKLAHSAMIFDIKNMISLIILPPSLEPVTPYTVAPQRLEHHPHL